MLFVSVRRVLLTCLIYELVTNSCCLVEGDVKQQLLNNADIEKYLLHEANRTKIRENLEYLTKHPHVAGSDYNNHLGDYISSKWEEFGFDSVDKTVYETLLSFPNPEEPNKIQLLDGDGNVLFTSQHMEKSLRPEDSLEGHMHLCHGLSPNGTVEGDLIYVNYARPEDFEYLSELGVNFTGTIVIARHGQNHRGNKVQLASQYGAVGVVLFSDPKQFAQEGEENVYPHSKWLPGSGGQRGSVKIGKGDIVTPDYPAIDGVYRYPVTNQVPKIPSQPIGYHDANLLLSSLGGLIAPSSWDMDYFIGPGFRNSSVTKRARLTVNNQRQYVNITNVIGIIKGQSEPDRYVLAGNHRDAWGFGAIDASSGTAQLIEVTRVFGLLLQKGWRPRRTLVFCSWDAEEFGLTGSYEWVEDNLIKLTHRAVAYLNTDTCVRDDLFVPDATPNLASFVLDVTKGVPSPANGSQSLYDTWYQKLIRLGEVEPGEEIRIKNPRGGTDHVPFFAYAGVATINIAFENNKLKYKRPFGSYPVYHTAFDNFYYVDKFIDPQYLRMAACGHFNLIALFRLSQAEILPFNISNYRNAISNAFHGLIQDGSWNLLVNKSINLEPFNRTFHDFINATIKWESQMKNFNSTDPLVVRSVNDQLMQLDKAFLKEGGIPLQIPYKHLVFAISLHNSYRTAAFPGIRDLLYEIQTHPVENDPRLTALEKHISDIVVAFHTATNILKPVYLV